MQVWQHYRTSVSGIYMIFSPGSLWQQHAAKCDGKFALSVWDGIILFGLQLFPEWLLVAGGCSCCWVNRSQRERCTKNLLVIESKHRNIHLHFGAALYKHSANNLQPTDSKELEATTRQLVGEYKLWVSIVWKLASLSDLSFINIMGLLEPFHYSSSVCLHYIKPTYKQRQRLFTGCIRIYKHKYTKSLQSCRSAASVNESVSSLLASPVCFAIHCLEETGWRSSSEWAHMPFRWTRHLVS